MNRDDAIQMIKKDLREHPQKASNLQYRISCLVDGFDVDEILEEMKHEKYEVPKVDIEKVSFYGTQAMWDRLPEQLKSVYLYVNIMEQDEYEAWRKAQMLKEKLKDEIENEKIIEKYKKIEQIVKSKTTRLSYDVGFEQIKEVIEDGNDD